MYLWLLPIVVGGILVSTAVHRQRRLAVLRRTRTTLVADLRAGPWDGGPAYAGAGHDLRARRVRRAVRHGTGAAARR